MLEVPWAYPSLWVIRDLRKNRGSQPFSFGEKMVRKGTLIEISEGRASILLGAKLRLVRSPLHFFFFFIFSEVGSVGLYLDSR